MKIYSILLSVVVLVLIIYITKTNISKQKQTTTSTIKVDRVEFVRYVANYDCYKTEKDKIKKGSLKWGDVYPYKHSYITEPEFVLSIKRYPFDDLNITLTSSEMGSVMRVVAESAYNDVVNSINDDIKEKEVVKEYLKRLND